MAAMNLILEAVQNWKNGEYLAASDLFCSLAKKDAKVIDAIIQEFAPNRIARFRGINNRFMGFVEVLADGITI